MCGHHAPTHYRIPLIADDPADPFARLGKPDAVFGPSPGQTFAGVLLGLGLAAVGLAVAILGDGLDGGNRVAVAMLGVAGLGLAVWVWRLRRWRLAVCPGGLVQLRATGVEELRWADMTEVIDTRMHALGGEQTIRVTAIGPSTRVVVNPINSRPGGGYSASCWRPPLATGCRCGSSGRRAIESQPG